MTFGALIASLTAACGHDAGAESPPPLDQCPVEIVQANAPVEGQREIYLAGGCFWGTEHLLKMLNGIVSTEVATARRAIRRTEMFVRRAGMPRRFTSFMIRRRSVSSTCLKLISCRSIRRS